MGRAGIWGCQSATILDAWITTCWTIPKQYGKERHKYPLKHRGNTKLLLKCILSNINYWIKEQQTKLENADAFFSTDNSESNASYNYSRKGSNEKNQMGKHFMFIYFPYKILNKKRGKILSTSNTIEYYSIIRLLYKQSYVAILFTVFFKNSAPNKAGNTSLRSLVINHSSVELMF